jgi:RNA polymerase sigma-70 factor (ECF subfamily)
LLNRLRDGDKTAAEELFHHYAAELWRLADRRIGDWLRRRVEADDVLQSVFRTFFVRNAKGEYAIEDTTSLRRLLVQITINKVRRQVEFHKAKKHNIDAEVDVDGPNQGLEFLARSPVAGEADMLLGELKEVVTDLDQDQAEMLGWVLAGESLTDVASRLGCSRFTVRRVLDRIGQRLKRHLEAELKK